MNTSVPLARFRRRSDAQWRPEGWALLPTHRPSPDPVVGRVLGAVAALGALIMWGQLWSSWAVPNATGANAALGNGAAPDAAAMVQGQIRLDALIRHTADTGVVAGLGLGAMGLAGAIAVFGSRRMAWSTVGAMTASVLLAAVMSVRLSDWVIPHGDGTTASTALIASLGAWLGGSYLILSSIAQLRAEGAARSLWEMIRRGPQLRRCSWVALVLAGIGIGVDLLRWTGAAVGMPLVIGGRPSATALIGGVAIGLLLAVLSVVAVMGALHWLGSWERLGALDATVQAERRRWVQRSVSIRLLSGVALIVIVGALGVAGIGMSSSALMDATSLPAPLIAARAEGVDAGRTAVPIRFDRLDSASPVSLMSAWARVASSLPGVASVEVSAGRFEHGVLVGRSAMSDEARFAMVELASSARSVTALHMVSALEAVSVPGADIAVGGPTAAARSGLRAAPPLAAIGMIVSIGAAVVMGGSGAARAGFARLVSLGTAIAVAVIAGASPTELPIVVVLASVVTTLAECSDRAHEDGLQRDALRCAVVIAALATLGWVLNDLDAVARFALVVLAVLGTDLLLWSSGLRRKWQTADLAAPLDSWADRARRAYEPWQLSDKSTVTTSDAFFVNPTIDPRWRRVVQGLLRAEFGLQTDPVAADLSAVFVENTLVYSEVEEHTDRLVSHGLRVEGKSPRLLSLEVIETDEPAPVDAPPRTVPSRAGDIDAAVSLTDVTVASGPSTVRLALVVDHPVRRLVGRDGAVLGVREPTAQAGELWLSRDPSGRYRILDAIGSPATHPDVMTSATR